jgi:signal peptidase
MARVRVVDDFRACVVPRDGPAREHIFTYSGRAEVRSYDLIVNAVLTLRVTLSGSMEPGIHRGDLLIVHKPRTRAYLTGDIVIYNIPNFGVPIVHRVLEARAKTGAKQLLLTKGDNNAEDDRALYDGPDYIDDTQVVGLVKGCVVLFVTTAPVLTFVVHPYSVIPYVGYASILFNEYPAVKYSIFGAMGLLSILSG